MRIKFRIIVLMLFCYSVGFYSQNYVREYTYLDAVQLSEGYKNYNVDYEKCINIFKKYNINNEADFKKNPFFKNITFEPLYNASIIGDSLSINKGTETSNIKDLNPAFSFPVNFQSNIINGLASFMAGRFKQEALQVSINQFFKKVKADKVKIVQGVFPKTFNYIDTFSTEANTYYGLDLILLRETAQMDINEVPNNISENAKAIFPNQESYFYDILKSTNSIYEFSKSGQALNGLFYSLAQNKYENLEYQKYAITADIISKAMENEKEEDTNWIPLSKVRPNSLDLNTPNEVLFFYGLLYEQLKNQLPEIENQNSYEISQNLYALFDFTSKLNATQKYTKTQDYTIKTPEAAIAYLKNITDVYSVFLKSISTNNLFKYNNFIEKQLELPKKYISIVEIFINKKYEKIIPLLIIQFKDEINEITASYRTLFLLSQIAVIDNATDMEAIMQSYALPIGSSSIKRNSTFNISLNGYVGATAGLETAFGNDQKQTKGNVGLAAPIGISSTFANGNLTMFVSVLDLGALVNQRLGNDTTNYNGLKFEHFLSPGLGLYYNFKNLPITTGFHYNRISNLRNIDFQDGISTISEKNLSVNRLNFSILIDLPFFTIYNSSNK